MLDAGFLVKVSRPRFWIYLFGPYIVGLAAAAASQGDFWRPEVIAFGLYFLLPANLLVYGVNDIFDFETDRLNPKKAEYEMLVRPASHKILAAWVIVLNLPLLSYGAVFARHALVPLAAFLFFSIFYSAPPIRAKTKPILDSAFNVLYVCPGVFAYQFVSGALPPASILIGAWLWTMAMHAYSAIPDIEADRDAGIATVATLLGRRGTLVFCLVLYLSSAIATFGYLGPVSFLLGSAYFVMIVASLFAASPSKIFSLYRYFPLVNAAAGFLLFCYAVYLNLP